MDCTDWKIRVPFTIGRHNPELQMWSSRADWGFRFSSEPEPGGPDGWRREQAQVEQQRQGSSGLSWVDDDGVWDHVAEFSDPPAATHAAVAVWRRWVSLRSYDQGVQSFAVRSDTAVFYWQSAFYVLLTRLEHLALGTLCALRFGGALWTVWLWAEKCRRHLWFFLFFVFAFLLF